MPWKVSRPDTEIFSPDAVLHMHDPKVGLHMETYINKGEILIYVGALDPEDADVLLSLNTRSPSGFIKVCHVTSDATDKQFAILDNVLSTLGIPKDRRVSVSRAIHHQHKGMKREKISA